MRRTLADGTVKTYTYDRKPPGKRSRYAPDSLGALILAYRLSPEWEALAESTRRMYAIYLRDLERMAHVPLADIRRRDLIEIRNAIASARGNGAGTGFLRASSAVFSWARDQDWIENSPAERIKALPGGHLPAWTPEQAAAALKLLPEPFRRVVVLGMWTGQRRSDLISLTWANVRGERIELVQKKTGQAVSIPISAALRVELDAWRRDAARRNVASLHLLTDADGRPWEERPSYLSHRLPHEMARAGLPALNTHGLRKLAAANLANAGCTVHEIAAITGHQTLAMVELYTKSADRQRLATAAIARLENVRGKRPRKTS